MAKAIDHEVEIKAWIARQPLSAQGALVDIHRFVCQFDPRIRAEYKWRTMFFCFGAEGLAYCNEVKKLIQVGFLRGPELAEMGCPLVGEGKLTRHLVLPHDFRVSDEASALLLGDCLLQALRLRGC